MKTFHLFGFPIHFLGLMTAIGVLIGYYFARHETKRRGLNAEKLDGLALVTVLSGLIGARVFYILFYNLSYYLETPLSVFRIYDGGMSIHGGLIFAFVAAFIYMKISAAPFLSYADAVAPSIILGQAIGRVGCDVFGKAMKTPFFFGVKHQGVIVHPVQIYEFLLNYVGFFILWRLRKHTRYPGQLFFLYIILFSINRAVVEFFRINPLLIGWFSISHLLSLTFIVLTMYLQKLVSGSAIQKQGTTPFNTVNLVKDSLMVFLFMVVSLVIFYLVQGS